MNNNENLKNEMAELQKELQKGLDAMLSEIGNKLKPNEKQEIQNEVDDIKELLQRLESGLIWLALFGKVSAGKSAIANSLMNDDIAEVNVKHGSTKEPKPYIKKPWCIVDVPGILDDKVEEHIALNEANKAHGHIFVIDKEPLGPEMELFDIVHKNTPHVPKIVFFNKLDMLTGQMPVKDQETVKRLVMEKMKKYVKSEDDIVFGSAQLYDKANDIMIRQRIPQLEDRLYEDTSTLGQMVNVIDFAKRGEELSGKVKEKILEVRKRVARKIIKAYAYGAIGTSWIPFDSLTVAPAMYASMVYALVKIMGEKESPNFNKGETALKIGKTCGSILLAEFAAVTVVETALSIFGPIGWLIDMAALSVFKYKRTIIFGEATLLYIENGFSFGNNPKEIMQEAREAAKSKYESFKK